MQVVNFFELRMYDECKGTFSYNISPPTCNIIVNNIMSFQINLDLLQKSVKACRAHCKIKKTHDDKNGHDLDLLNVIMLRFIPFVNH